MAAFEKQIDTIRSYLAEYKAERYPLENELLSKKAEYVKSLYFRMLCTLVRYTGDPSEMQVLYIRRLIAGTHAESEFQDYMKMALDLDTEDIDEFISVFKEDDLKYYFCIDGAIVLSVRKADEKNYELFAELIELLGITRDELTYLVSVARAILCASSEQLDLAKKISPKSTKDLSLRPYVAGFYTGMLADTSKLRYIYSCNKTEVNLSNYTAYDAKRVILENITISLQQDLVFDGCAEVIIRKCSFHGNSNRLKFLRVGHVTIEECEISNFSNRFAIFTDTNNLYLNKNRFVNCGCISDRDIKGGVLFSNGNSSNSDGMNSVVIENNELLNCYVARTERRSNYWATGVLLHLEKGANKVRVTENHFSGCECRKNGDYAEAYITGNVHSAIEENNICDGPVKVIFGN